MIKSTLQRINQQFNIDMNSKWPVFATGSNFPMEKDFNNNKIYLSIIFNIEIYLYRFAAITQKW